MNVNHPKVLRMSSDLPFASASQCEQHVFLPTLFCHPQRQVWCVGGASMWAPWTLVVVWFAVIVPVTAARASQHSFLLIPVSR